MLVLCCTAFAQRHTDLLNRGLVAVPVGSTDGSTSNVVTWRRLADEYFGVTYNLYKDGSKVASNLTTTCYNDSKSAPPTTTYQVAAVVNGVEQEKCTAITPWLQYVYQLTVRCPTGYLDINLATVYDREGTDVTSHYEPNDAEMADLDGDGDLEIIIKRLNTVDVTGKKSGLKDKDGHDRYIIYPADSKEFVVLDAYDVNWQNGEATLMWRIDCGPNMVSANSTEINIVAYDWDEDGKAEVVLRGADNMIVYGSDGKTQKFTIGDMTVNTRPTWYGTTQNGDDISSLAFTSTGAEYLIYMNGQTGALYQKMDYPLTRESASAWGDESGHRSSKYFFGAPFLDGRTASLFLGRGIYTRHKMMALDLNKGSHEWSERWSWNCNDTSSPWYGNGYHNFVIADVDEDGRDEIVYGSMVIDDNGKGLSTTGYQHGDAQHVGDFDPYRKGLEFYGCLEDNPYWGSNYRNAATSEVYYKHTNPDGDGKSGDDGRCLMGNFSDEYPGSIGRSVGSGIISSVKDVQVVDTATANSSNLNALYWSHLNFRIFWDGDLGDEVLDGSGNGSEAAIFGYDCGRMFTSSGCNMNNGSKNNPCFQGDIIGDWREEIVVRHGAGLRVYTTGMYTDYSMPCLWYDHQYRQAMVWQMMAYNQPPHPSFFVGELEGITQAPPPLTNTGRTEIANGGSITSANTTPVMLCATSDMTVSVGENAAPGAVYVNTPSWVQGSDVNGTTGTKVKTDGKVGATNLPEIVTTTYTHTLTGNAFTGSTNLVKQGDGLLILPDVTETYTGNTEIWAGSMAFSGTLSSSPVWMNRHTNLYGAPTISNSLTMEYGSAFCPSAAGVTDASTASYATVNIGTLNMHEGSRIVFQLDPANGQSDQVNIETLNLRTRSGDAWENYGPEYLKPVIEIDAKSDLGSGKYTLGTLTNLSIDGTPVSESTETPISSVAVEGAGDGKLYFYQGKLILLFDGADWETQQTTTLLAEDYESYAVGDITSTMQSKGWTFQSRNSKNEVTIKQGTSPNATKYFDFYYPDGGASRNQRWDFGVESSLDADNWTLTFSAALNPGLNNSANKFYITGTSTGNVETANNDVTNPLFALKALDQGSAVYKPTIGATSYDEEYTLASGTWYKFTVRATKIDAVNNTANLYVKITSYDGGTTILEKVVQNLNTSAIGKLRGLCWNSPRGSSRLNLDDVLLTKKVVTAVSKTITSAGWATLYTPYALDFSGVEGLTAYTATCSENTVTLKSVNNVPANTGVVLKGAANTYSILVIASSSTAQGDLKGSATDATAWNAYNGYTLYVLTSVDAGANVQFNPVTSGSIAAGKAYLKIASGANPAREMKVVFDDDILTGINEAKSEVKAVKEGKFFENGKLIIFKKGMKFNANGQLVK